MSDETGRPEPGHEVDEEISFHLERRVEALVAGGMDPDEARREARRRFGDVEDVRMKMERESRRRRREGELRERLDGLRRDLRYALRQLVRSPVFSAVIVLTLALGIGSNTAIFSVVDHVLLRPLPYPEPDELAVLWTDVTRRGGPADEWLSYANFADARDQLPAVEAAAVWSGFGPTLTGVDEPRAVQGALVSRPMFGDVLGVEPVMGRGFTPEEDLPGGPNVLLLSDAFWRNVLGADPDVVGRSLILNGVPYEVIGVMPPDFRPPFVPGAEVWGLPQIDAAAMAGRRGGFSWRSVLRLAEGVSLDEARAQADALARRLEQSYPESNTGMGFTLRSLQDDMVETARTGLWVVMGAVGMVLLVACVNVANLLLARASSRTGELSVRAALGAGRRRITAQLLVESLVLAGLGGVAGVGLGVLGTRGLVALAPPGTPRIEAVSVDLRILGFSLAVTVLAGLLFGLLPALRTARADLQSALREGGRGGQAGGRKGLRLRNGLVTAQVALALVVLVGAGLLLRSFQNLRTVDLGYEPAGVMTFFLNLPANRYGDGDTRRDFVSRLVTELEAVPGVASAGVVEALPLSGFDGDVTFNIEGRPLPEPGEEDAAWLRRSTPGYLDAMGLRLLSGRFIEAGDVEAAPQVMVINETFAEWHFPDTNPLGSRVNLGSPEDPSWWEIVGVVADTRHFAVRDDRREAMYLSYFQSPPGFVFVAARVEGGRDPVSVMPDARRVLAGLDPTLAPQRVRPMTEVVEAALAPDRFLAVLLSLFAGVTLVLAVVGLYGVIAYAVNARLREMGVRMALGAEAGRIGRQVVGRSLVLAGAGVFLGGLLAAAGAPALRTLLYGVAASDPATFASVAGLLLAVAAAAAAVPAWRAARIDPVKVLRAE